MDYSELTIMLQEPAQREQAFEQLYEEAFPAVAGFVRRMGGSFSDAKDIFHDALIIFYEKTVHQQTHITAAVPAYVLGIAKHLWVRKYKGDQQHVSLEGMEKEVSIPYDFYEPKASENRLLQYLAAAGKKCMEMLRSFYYSNLTMQEIAETFGYGSVRSATVQKFKCLEKVREKVKNEAYEEVFE